MLLWSGEPVALHGPCPPTAVPAIASHSTDHGPNQPPLPDQPPQEPASPSPRVRTSGRAEDKIGLSSRGVVPCPSRSEVW
jgi:hypothetical protein